MSRIPSKACLKRMTVKQQSGYVSTNTCLASSQVCCACRCATRATIDKDNASVLVCGGGGVALLTAKKLRDLGAWVWMLQRTQNRK